MIVLLALDDSDASHEAALAATQLFGSDADYLAVHVADPVPVTPGLGWGAVSGYPYPAVPPGALRAEPSRSELVQDARRRAAELAAQAGVGAAPVGEVGDAADAILRAADEHHADVIVVGWHHRGWLTRVLEPSVTDDVAHGASVPVVVVPVHEDS